MQRREETLRHVILLRLFSHIERYYSTPLPKRTFIRSNITNDQIDALIAFKSDPVIDELRSALARLGDGTFGSCLSCKGEIAHTVLMSDPARRFCEVCERHWTHVEHQRNGVGVQESVPQ